MNNQTVRSNTFIPIFIIGTLFFIFGFVTWLNGVLIPYLQTACELSNTAAFLVTVAFYISYFVMALSSSSRFISGRGENLSKIPRITNAIAI